MGNWVVTPRIGRSVELRALWYNALRIMAGFARRLAEPTELYDAAADHTQAGFARF